MTSMSLKAGRYILPVMRGESSTIGDWKALPEVDV